MKTYISYKLQIFFILIIIASCTNDPKCELNTGASGSIISEIDLGECFDKLIQDTIIISDTNYIDTLYTLIDSAYNSNIGSDCDPEIDTIDFNNYSILGLYAEGIGCNVNFYKEFIINTIDKTYNYNIKVEECGDCSYTEFSMNWILVDKIDSTYTINYSIEILE